MTSFGSHTRALALKPQEYATNALPLAPNAMSSMSPLEAVGDGDVTWIGKQIGDVELLLQDRFICTKEEGLLLHDNKY
jgi:hypothetical protein